MRKPRQTPVGPRYPIGIYLSEEHTRLLEDMARNMGTKPGTVLRELVEESLDTIQLESL